jgi:hypothetical protein
VSQPAPLLTIAGQVVPPHLAARMIDGYANSCIDQNGSPYKLFTPPPPTTPPEPARVVRRVAPTGDFVADASDARPGSMGTVA